MGGVVPDTTRLIARSPDEHRRRGIDVQIRHQVTAIEPEAGSVTVRDLESGAERREGYDELMVATGAVPIRPDLPGAGATGIFGVQVLEDGLALRRLLASDDAPRRAVVIGAGYIGLEIAEAMVQRGLEVALVDQAPQPMSTLDPDMGALVADGLRAIGVALHLGAAVEGYDTNGKAVSAVVTSGATHPADVVILGLGVRPNTALAEAGGIPVGPSGGLAVDQRMHARCPAVWAAGDCVEVHHRVSRRPTTIALGTHAN
ncbi:MAG: NAD(P)/FAD-dependent oxidoreductase, partial [Acidimicrobiia bacterium]